MHQTLRQKQHLRQQAGIARQVGDSVTGIAGLPGAQQLARTAQLQILLGDEEAVVGLPHHVDALAGHGRQR